MTPKKRRAAASARAFAPGSVGNLGPGLDILGLALAACGDRVEASWTQVQGIVIADPGHPSISTDPDRNTAGLAAREVLRRAGHSGTGGLRLVVQKGLPLSGGQGGSAASAVAAAVAVNHLLGAPLGRMTLLEACLAAEEAVAGRHADNIAPSLFGGIVLIRSLEPPDLVQLPVPHRLHVALAHPDQQLRTMEGRAVLPGQVSRDLAMYQAAQVAAMVAALGAGDLRLLGRALDDRIAEPARAPLLPGFAEAKAAALEAGALGGSISGSGPTAFALVNSEAAGERVAEAMAAAYRRRGVSCQTLVSKVDRKGARLES
jgi:homoserine kinase